MAPHNTLIIEDGQQVELDKESLQRGERFEMRKGVIVEGQFMESDPAVFAQRSQLSRTGIVFASFVRDARSHKLLEPPIVTFYGMLFREGIDPAHIPLDASDMLEDLWPDISRREDWRDVVKLELRRFFKKRASNKPVVMPVLQDV